MLPGLGGRPDKVGNTPQWYSGREEGLHKMRQWEDLDTVEWDSMAMNFF